MGSLLERSDRYGFKSQALFYMHKMDKTISKAVQQGLKAAATCVVLCRWREGAASPAEAEHLS